MIELAPRHKHGLALSHPVMNAAGVLGLGSEMRGLVDLARLGAFVTNPLTLNPRSPARPPNAVAVPDGVLIHTGLPGPGLRATLRGHDRDWQRLGAPVILHLAATSEAEVSQALDLLERSRGVSGLELGLRDDASPGECARVVRAAAGGPPLLARLPLGRAAELARAVAGAGANALVVAAPPRVAVKVGEQTVTGRLYGPVNFAPALQAVRAVLALGLDLPVVAAGGIHSVENALEMLAAGADAVQVDGAVWQQPGLMAAIAAAAEHPGPVSARG
jgi:dihydroorotate dehydrogenase (NAD+) catalytic subunit